MALKLRNHTYFLVDLPSFIRRFTKKIVRPLKRSDDSTPCPMTSLTAVFHFQFEEDFVEEGIRCIPMIVRFKLDRCGIKLKLTEWSKLNELERQHLAELECESEEDVTVYRSWLQMAVVRKTGLRATDLQVVPGAVWANTSRVPDCVEEKVSELQLSLTIDQWTTLTELQRFALVKLSRPGHENRNFPIALKEFLGG